MAAVSNLIHAGVSPQGHIVLSFIYNKHASLFELQILYSAAELWARLTANTQTGKHLSVVISIQGVHFSPICPFLSTVVRIAWPWETHNNNELLPIASREHQIHLYPLDELTLFFHPDFFFSGLQILTCQTIETPAPKGQPIKAAYHQHLRANLETTERCCASPVFAYHPDVTCCSQWPPVSAT